MVLNDIRTAAPGLTVTTLILALFPVAVVLYILLLFDVALPGRNFVTLAGITLLMLVLIGARAFFIRLRHHMLVLLGDMVAARLSPRMAQAGPRVFAPVGDDDPSPGDMDAIQLFLKSGAGAAWIDIVGLAVAVLVMLVLHPLLALALVLGAGLSTLLLFRTMKRSERAARDLRPVGRRRDAAFEIGRMYSASLRALGMSGTLAALWRFANDRVLAIGNTRQSVQTRGQIAALSLQLATMVLLLATGGWLHMQDRASEAVLLAAALLGWLAMAPLVRAAEHADQLIDARLGWERIDALLSAAGPSAAEAVPLPPPTRTISCENVAFSDPSTNRALVRYVSFALSAGDVLAVIGRAGCGKSVLLRGLAGGWPLAEGKVRLDGAALDQWDADLLGRHIGYMPQTIDLIDGSVADNIARFAQAADPKQVIAAAQNCGAHDMIVRLPDGYNTRIGPHGHRLSLSQMQQVALARAFYRDPFLLVLDAPTSHQDAAREQLFRQAVDHARARGAIVIIAGAQNFLVGLASHVLLMRDGGTVAEFGTRDEVQERLEERRRARPLSDARTDTGDNGSAGPQDDNNDNEIAAEQTL